MVKKDSGSRIQNQAILYVAAVCIVLAAFSLGRAAGLAGQSRKIAAYGVSGAEAASSREAQAAAAGSTAVPADSGETVRSPEASFSPAEAQTADAGAALDDLGSRYSAASVLRDSGSYREAAGAFRELGDYEDSAEQAAACDVLADGYERTQAAGMSRVREIVALMKAEEPDMFALYDAFMSDEYQAFREFIPADGILSEDVYVRKNHIYSGGISDGLPEGHGRAFRAFLSQNSSGSSRKQSRLYDGEWHEGAPDGKGTEYRYWFSDPSSVTTAVNTGTFDRWYQEGEMTSVYTVNTNSGMVRTYRYAVKDHMPVGIDTRTTGNGELCTVVAYPEEDVDGFLTFYDTPQTVLGLDPDLGDGIRKNANGYWNTTK